MEQDQPLLRGGKNSFTVGAGRKSFIIVLLILVSVAALIAASFLLPASYSDLILAIQQERTDYVNEIANQLISCHRVMTDEFSASARRMAGVINRSGAVDMEDLAACFIPEDADRVLLVNPAGEITDLTGRLYFSSDRELISNLCGDPPMSQLFASLNNEMDYWLFAAALRPLTIDNKEYTTVVLAIPADEFGHTLAVSLFGNRGASYIITAGGGVELKPESVNMAFGGYNLFSSLLQAGATEEQVGLLRSAIAQGGSGSLLLEIQNSDWLFGYADLDGESSMVVAIPLTLTAAQTYRGLSRTLIIFAVTIALVGLVALLIMLLFFYRDKERSRIALAAEAKSDFFSKMSHDIRTPLNAIIGLQTLIKESDDPATVKEYNAQSTIASAYLLSIINDVLDMSRIESGGIPLSQEPFDMNELLTGVGALIAGMAADKEIIFAVEKDSPFATYYVGDGVRIRQVLVNLLNNAVKFTPPQGRVLFSVTHQPDDVGGDEFTFIVSDTGIGMSEEYLAKAFIPFEQEQSAFTQEYSGSGLGLAIVHSLVAQMQGSIEVESKQGQGSTFTVVLPLPRGDAIAQPEAGGASLEEQAVFFAGKRVLLAEDNSVNQMIVVRLLSKKFHLDIEAASDGEQALTMFQSSAPGHYDLILLDIKMPNMDGLEAARAIRGLPRADAATVPIVALSANAYAEDVALSLEAGMNAHLAKPLDIHILTSTLQKFLNNQEAGL